MLKFIEMGLEGLLKITPPRFADERGFFVETYSFKDFAVQFCQDNMSFSKHAGTIRGLHYQNPPFAQAKLVSVVRGSILDVAVDLRKSSATFGKHISCVLSESNGEQLYVPEGFAHGFITLEPDTIVCYKVTNFYSKEHDRGIRFDDKDLAIAWPEKHPFLLSEKDRHLPTFSQIESPF